MSKSDGNFKLEWDGKSSKPFLTRVNLPSKIHPVFREIHHHDKLLDIVSDLVTYIIFIRLMANMFGKLYAWSDVIGVSWSSLGHILVPRVIRDF